MKKIIGVLILGALLSTCLQGASAEDNIRVTYNGADIPFNVAPAIINNRTMVPLRAIFEIMGAKVDWNENTKKIKSVKDNTTVIMQIDDSNMYVNGSTIALDSAPVILDGRALIPVRAIADAYNVRTIWDADERLVALAEKSGDFDKVEYNLKNKVSTVYTGKTRYQITVPQNIDLKRRMDYYGEEFDSDNLVSYSDNMILNFNTGAYISNTETFKSFDDFMADYKRRFPSSNDEFESIYFDYHIDGNYEVVTFINKHTYNYVITDPEILEIMQTLSEIDEFGETNSDDSDVTYEGYTYYINMYDKTDVGHLSIDTKDPSKIETMKEILTSVCTK